MTDDDFLGGLLLDDGDSAQKPEPALITFPPAAPAELLVRERMFRFAESLAVKAIIFTCVDDDTGEVWDDGQAERWQRIMSWPVLPEIADALAFKHYHEMKLLADHWDELQAARSAVP